MRIMRAIGGHGTLLYQNSTPPRDSLLFENKQAWCGWHHTCGSLRNNSNVGGRLSHNRHKPPAEEPVCPSRSLKRHNVVCVDNAVAVGPYHCITVTIPV